MMMWWRCAIEGIIIMLKVSYFASSSNFHWMTSQWHHTAKICRLVLTSKLIKMFMWCCIDFWHVMTNWIEGKWWKENEKWKKRGECPLNDNQLTTNAEIWIKSNLAVRFVWEEMKKLHFHFSLNRTEWQWKAGN